MTLKFWHIIFIKTCDEGVLRLCCISMGGLKGTGSGVISLWIGTRTSRHGEPNVAQSLCYYYHRSSLCQRTSVMPENSPRG
jgi:hypothetical protein